MSRSIFNKVTREHFESSGWNFELTEYYNGWAKRYKDFGGFADAIVWIPASDKTGKQPVTAALQITDKGHWTTRKKKILQNGKAKDWLLCGNLIWIIAWKTQVFDLHNITLEDFGA